MIQTPAGSSTARRGVVILLTGLPGAGKTSIASALKELMLVDGGRDVLHCDGDILRDTFQPPLGFSRNDRAAQMERITSLALDVVRRGGVAICSAVAPYDADRQKARTAVETAGAFFLVYVATPLGVCEARDPKGLYAKARAGAIEGFTGVSDPYEIPTDAHVTVDTTTMSAQFAAAHILSELPPIWPVRQR
jgi:sulfate adenylyltransferase